MTPTQADSSDVEKVAKLAEKFGLTFEQFIGQKPWFKSRGFWPYRWADHKEFNECVEELAAAIEKHERRKKARTAEVARRFRDAIKALVLDLYIAHLSDPELQVGINLNANSFSESKRYRNAQLTYKQFKAVCVGLLALQYVSLDKRGFFDHEKKAGYNTKIRATDKLVSFLNERAGLHLHRIARVPYTETILLKDKNKKLIDYEETDEIRRMRDNLAVINGVLRRWWMDLEITDTEFSDLQRRLQGDPDPEKQPIDFTKRMLYRPFNNGSFGEGGRFYGGW